MAEPITPASLKAEASVAFTSHPDAVIIARVLLDGSNMVAASIPPGNLLSASFVGRGIDAAVHASTLFEKHPDLVDGIKAAADDNHADLLLAARLYRHTADLIERMLIDG